MALTVLHPPGASIAEVVGDLRGRGTPTDRPYVVANFVSTVDGSVALDGGSGAIAAYAPGDRPLLKRLREEADAVLAGTGTIAREQYRRLVRDPAAQERRLQAGLTRDPLAVVLSRSGKVPPGVPMLEDPGQPSRVFEGAAAGPEAALAALRHEDGVTLLLCEGGPRLLGDLVRRGLVDELFLTISPVLGGGLPEATLLAGPPDRPRPLSLLALMTEGGGLHARYAMLAAGETPLPRPTSGALQPQ